MGFEPGAAIVRTLELEAGSYSFEMQGGDGFAALGCATEVLWEPPVEPSNGDLPNEADGRLPVWFDAGEPHAMDLTSGKYVISISSGSNGRVSTETTVTRLD